MRNRAPCTCTPGRARGKVELQFSAAYLRCENWEHQKKQLSGRLMFAAPTRARFWAETSVKAQSKLSSCGISQLFPHEQRSPYPRSTADNCTAGQVSGCWTKSPRLGCCCWTLAWFYLWTASTALSRNQLFDRQYKFRSNNSSLALIESFEEITHDTDHTQWAIGILIHSKVASSKVKSFFKFENGV